MSTSAAHQITKAARLLMNGRPHELRIIRKGQSALSGVYPTPERLAAEAVKFDGTAQVYVSLNPTSKAPYDIRPGDAVADEDIVGIRWLGIDLDNGEPYMPVVDYLKTAGFPQPVIGFSGTGYWLLYQIDQPNTADTADLRHRFLQALKAKFPGVDVSVYNASRITRLYGTLNIKPNGKRSHFVSVPNDITIVDQALIETIAADVPERKAPRPEDGIPGDVAVYIDALADRGIDVKKTKSWEHGSTLYDLSTCPFYPNATHEGAHLTAWADGHVSFKCPGNRCIAADNRTLALQELLDLRTTVDVEPVTADDIKSFASSIVRMDQVTSRLALTMWDTRLNQFDLNLIVGDEKVGKGLLMCWLVAALTQGWLTGRRETVMYFSPEEALETVQRPRLEVAGADPTKVLLRSMGSIGLPDCIPLLIGVAKQAGVTWLFIDTINKHFTDEYDGQKSRDVTKILGALAVATAEARITTVASLHTNRAESGSSRDRYAHSLEFRRAARSSVMIGRSVDMDEKERGIVHDLNNYTELSEPLRAHIEAVPLVVEGETKTYGKLVVDGTGDITATDLLQGDAMRANTSKEPSKTDTCMFDIMGTWERKQEPSVLPSTAFKGLNEAYGASTVQRAKASLGITSVRTTNPDTGEFIAWEWHFPPALKLRYREVSEKV